MTEDLYFRVRRLPEQLEKARRKVRDIERRIEWLKPNYTWRNEDALIKAKARLAEFENRARQYNLLDLLE